MRSLQSNLNALSDVPIFEKCLSEQKHLTNVRIADMYTDRSDCTGSHIHLSNNGRSLHRKHPHCVALVVSASSLLVLFVGFAYTS